MQNLRLLALFALVSCAAFLACHKDKFFEKSKKTAHVTFAGRVVDENGEAVAHALVQSGEESENTDDNGVFRLKTVEANADHAILSVTKAGYFAFSRAYIVEDGALQTVNLQLLSKIQIGTINTSTGGTVEVPGDAKLSFPTNAFADESGTIYNGTAIVYARYLSPTDPNLSQNMPGNLTGLNKLGIVEILATFGMLGVEITSQDGLQLKIAANKEVEISMPIVATQQSSAPAEIPLWHYDVAQAYWVQESSAQKIGNEYVGKVTHFSFWNWDIGVPLVQLHGKIYLENTSQPFPNATVRITMLSNGLCVFGLTDNNGCFSGSIPKDEALLLEISFTDQCGMTVVYTQNIGPFSDETTLTPIIVNGTQSEIMEISGTLRTCNGAVVSNGYALVQFESAAYHLIFADSVGHFSLTTLICNSAVATGTCIGFDMDNLLKSAVQNFSIPPNILNLGIISLCEITPEHFIEYTLDGQSFVSTPGKCIISDGTTLVFNLPNDTLQSIAIGFQNNNQTGTFPIQHLTANGNYSHWNFAAGMSTTLAIWGDVGAPIIGTFGGTFIDDNTNAQHTLSGSYNVLRY